MFAGIFLLVIILSCLFVDLWASLLPPSIKKFKIKSITSGILASFFLIMIFDVPSIGLAIFNIFLTLFWVLNFFANYTQLKEFIKKEFNENG